MAQHSAEVLCSVPKCKKAMLCLIEKTHVLDRLSSGMSYGAIGREFNVNKQYILNKASLTETQTK